MGRMRSPYEFLVFGKVNVEELLREWEQETVCDVYEEPSAGWRLKFSYVFDYAICALLFENTAAEGTTYYRALFYREEKGQLGLVKKVRFRENDGFRVDAIGVDVRLTALFICRSSAKTSCDFHYNKMENVDVDIRNRLDLMDMVLRQSGRSFAMADGNAVLFVRTPDSRRMESIGEPQDFLYRIRQEKTGDDDAEETENESLIIDEGGADDGAEDGEDENDDTKCHAQARQAVSTGKSAMDELRGLIGLDEIKGKVDQIVAFARLQKLAKEQGRKVEGINLNLAFLGNPGTAKTTVARLFARIMKENGVLSEGNLIETGRADLVAKYTGQTAIKVKEVFKKAKGNVLFIDEAYSLLDSWENEYGDEAIATIVQEMENNRDDMVVIFAGYPDQMEKFLSRNPGLRSRVPLTVLFRDYTADELTRIAKSEAARRGYSVSDEAEEKIHGICAAALKAEEFGNGRFSRNLVEAAIMRAASRTVGSLSPGADLSACFRLEACDFGAPDNLKEDKRKRVIGFGAA